MTQQKVTKVISQRLKTSKRVILLSCERPVVFDVIYLFLFQGKETTQLKTLQGGPRVSYILL